MVSSSLPTQVSHNWEYSIASLESMEHRLLHAQIHLKTNRVSKSRIVVLARTVFSKVASSAQPTHLLDLHIQDDPISNTNLGNEEGMCQQFPHPSSIGGSRISQTYFMVPNDVTLIILLKTLMLLFLVISNSAYTK